MKQTVAPITPLDQDTAALVALYDEAAHVDVHAFKPAGRPRYSQLRQIIFCGRRYDDKGAACACADLRLFKFGDTGYTLCAAHGLLDIGHLRRELTAANHGRRP